MDVTNFLRNVTKKHGIAEDIETGKKKIVAQMITKGFTLQEIQKISGLPLDYITNIAQSFKTGEQEGADKKEQK